MSREQVAGGDRCKLSFNEKIPRLTGRSCGEFPGIGPTLPSRHFLLVARQPSLAPASPHLPPEACAACQIFGDFFKSKFLFQSLPRLRPRRVGTGFSGRAAFALSATAHSVTGKYRSP